jgi:hypothetical protein
MLNHTAITDRFKQYMPSIEASRQEGIAYAITEDAAVLGGAPKQFSGGFGYALWAVDFNLVAMTRGVARVSNLAGRPSAKRVFWVPDHTGEPTNKEPQVRAPFPAAIFAADFIDNGGRSAVEGIETESDLTSAYAMYDGDSGRLKRIALVNMKLYNGTESKKRGSETFRFSVPDSVECVKVRSLHADKGVAAMGFDYGGTDSNVTWAGEQWTYGVDEGKGHFPSGGVEEENIKVEEGIAEVKVPDSEAVIVFVLDEGSGA